MNRITGIILTAVFCIGQTGLSQTPTWPQFLGAGRSVDTEKQQVPDSFGPDRNVVWKTKVIQGSSSPCIWGDQLFLTGFEGDKLAVLCYSCVDGELLWRTDFDGPANEKFLHPSSSPAAPTACTDGQRVVAYFGSYGLVALDMNGKELWKKEFEFAPTQFGYGTSPVLHGDSVYLVRDRDQGSSVHCFNIENGSERWVTPRPEARANFGTPLVRGDELIVVGSSVLKAYDLSTGKQKWWVGGLTAIVCTSPIASEETIYFGGWSTANVQPDQRLATGFDSNEKLNEEDLQSVAGVFAKLDADKDGKLSVDEVPPGRARDAFEMFDFNRNGLWEQKELEGLTAFPTAPGENVLVAVKPGGAGDMTQSNILWRKNKAIPYVATPLLYRGKLYYFKKGGLVSCIDAKTGEAYYEAKRLGVPGEYYSTPVGVGNRVFVGAERGKMLVLGTGDELEIIARNDFGDKIVASPAVVENTMYLRTAGHLYAIGDPGSSKSGP